MHRRPAARTRGRQRALHVAHAALPAPPPACSGASPGHSHLRHWQPRPASAPALARLWSHALARGRPARHEAFRTLRHGGGESDGPAVAAPAAGAAGAADAAAGVAASARRNAQLASPADMFQSALSSLDLFEARPPPIEDELDLDQTLASVEQGASASVGRAVYEVLRIDRAGKMRRIYVKRRDLLRANGLQPRDLRRIDPSLSLTKTAPNITIKEDVLLINLGGVRAIVAAKKCLLFEPASASSSKFLQIAAPRLQANEGARLMREFRGKEPPFGPHADSEDAPPFELEMLEAALMVATGRLDAEMLAVSKRVSKVLQRLPRDITPVNLEELRRVKQTLVELESKADTLRDMLEEMMDDEDEVREMNLSSRPLREERRRQREIERIERGREREREREWPGEDAAGSARRTSASGRHPLGDDGAPERNAASPSHSGGPGTASSNGAGPSPYGHSSAPALPSGGGGIGVSAASAGGSGSEHSSSSSSVARVGLARAPSGRRDADGQRTYEEDGEMGEAEAALEELEEAEAEEQEVEEAEDLLEYYLQRAATTQSEAERLLAGARDLEESIGVSLSARRFEVNRLELTLSIGSFAAALGAMVAGIFGMNLRSTLENSIVGFWGTTAGIVLGCVWVFISLFSYTRRRRIL